MAKLPSFQFYPGDWRKDPALSRCSKAAKGVWMDMLCLMFECEVRGVFSTGGKPWPDGDIAAAVGGDTAENLSCIRELLTKGVASRNSAGAIFSRRLVREEQIRAARAAAGRLGGKQKASKSVANRLAKPQQRPEDEDEDENSSSRGDAGGVAERLRELGATSHKARRRAAAGLGASLERLEAWLAIARLKCRPADQIGFVIEQLASGEGLPRDVAGDRRKAETAARVKAAAALKAEFDGIPAAEIRGLVEAAEAQLASAPKTRLVGLMDLPGGRDDVEGISDKTWKQFAGEQPFWRDQVVLHYKQRMAGGR